MSTRDGSAWMAAECETVGSSRHRGGVSRREGRTGAAPRTAASDEQREQQPQTCGAEHPGAVIRSAATAPGLPNANERSGPERRATSSGAVLAISERSRADPPHPSVTQESVESDASSRPESPLLHRRNRAA
jgi:hypothetical protein